MPRLLSFFVTAALACVPAIAAAQTVEAVSVAGAPPRLDGRLTEDVWRTAPAVSGLVQREPTEGAPAIEHTEVRFAYDDEALWIGARMHSRAPHEVRALVTRRDREGSSEQIVISLDTRRDRRTAYTFSVTPGGVRVDWYHPADRESERDYGFDPVWQAATRIDSLGWTAEMRIPFTQLRFNPSDRQLWGINVVRLVPARNEESYWVLVRRDETGWASRMATLTGIRGIRPSRRIELLPYVAAHSRFNDEIDRRDPFARARDTGGRLGADLKMGVGPNLTLDVTLNPDFGQVEADPAEVNLTAYETFFDERRPFFTEGSQLLGGRGLFYTRRIGAPPPGFADADYAETIDNTTILGAAKLTGRMPSGLSVATLAAVTDREIAATFDTAERTFGSAVVAPRTAYAVASLQQEFGRDRSTLAVLLTGVHRDLEASLGELLSRSAYSGLVDTRVRWAGGAYDASAYVGFTHVRGDPGAMLRLQRSSRRYWQRPDASHVAVDPTRRTLSGTMLGVNHSKLAGKHWLWDIDYWQESPGLEPNDAGAFGAVDDRGLAGGIRYRENRPSRLLRSWQLGVDGDAEWNFEGLRRTGEVNAFVNVTFPNFWRFSGDVWREGRGLSDRLARGGPVMQTGREWGVDVELSNQSGARNRWGVEVSATRDELGGWSRDVELSLSFRPGTRFEVSVDPSWQRSDDARQYVTTVADGRPETYGTRYVFAHVDRSEVAVRLRVNYTLTPNLTLESYAEPFASSGTYHGFGEVRAPGALALLGYGSNGTAIVRNPDGSRTVSADGRIFTLADRDFNVRSLRTNLVLRWEWRPGSTMFLVWQQDQSADRDPARVRPGDIWDAFSAGGDTFLAIKVSYWFAVK